MLQGLHIDHLGFACPGQEQANGFDAGTGLQPLAQNLCAQVAKTIEQVTRLLQPLVRTDFVEQFKDGSLGD